MHKHGHGYLNVSATQSLGLYRDYTSYSNIKDNIVQNNLSLHLETHFAKYAFRLFISL